MKKEGVCLTWQVRTASTTPSRACPQAAITETRALPTPLTFLKWNQMPSKLSLWRRIGMCDVFLFATSDSGAHQTKPISLLIGCHSKSILGQASMFQMGRFKQPTAMAGRTSVNPTATQTFFSLRNLCGQGKGAGRETRSRVATSAEILLAATPKHPLASPHLNHPSKFHPWSPKMYFGK